MNVKQISRWFFLAAGVYAVLCIPGIFLAERFGWPETPFHVTQLLAVAMCFPASLLFLWRSRGSRFGALEWLAVAAAVLSGLWLSALILLVLTLDFSGIDIDQ